MAGGYFGLTQASSNTLQIKERQLTVKHMILPMLLLTFSQQKRQRRQKSTPSLGNESYVSEGSKKESELRNNCIDPYYIDAVSQDRNTFW